MWNRSPSWPSSSAWANVPSDPAVSDPYSGDPYRDGQFTPVLAPVPTNPLEDQIRSEPYAPPYSGPHDLDDYGRETPEMQRAYLDFHRKEPAVRSAIDGKVASVAALDVTVIPRDKTKQADRDAAAWVKETVSDTLHGWEGLISNMLRPAFIIGFSLGEMVGIGQASANGPRWGLRHVKSKDTSHIKLRLDGYRNVLGIVNTVRGTRTHDPAKCILFTHADLFDNPFGQSDLRAAYRSANLINDAYQVWYTAIKLYGGPFLSGKVADDVRRKQMETALRAARAAGFIVCNERDSIEVINLASATSFDAFEKKIRIHREEIYLAVRNAYMPFMQSSSGGADQRGDTGVNKHAAADPVEYLLSKAVGRVLTHQLCPILVTPNFPPGTGMPRIVLGGVNWAESKTQLEVAVMLKEKFGLDTSAEHIYEVSQMPPPKDPVDVPPGPKQPGAPGMPGMLGAPAAAPTPGAAPPADPIATPAMFGAAARSPVDLATDELIAEFARGAA